MSKTKETGLGQPAKSVVDSNVMDVNDIAAAVSRLNDDTEASPATVPEVETPKELEKTATDDTAVAVEEEAKEDVLPEIEETTEAPDPTSEAELEYPKFKKRVDTLTAQKKEALAKVEMLEAQLLEAKNAKAEAPEPSAPPTPTNPLLHITSWADLKREESSTEGVVEWCDANEDGAVVKQADGSEREYSAKDVRDVRRNAEKALRKHIPAQADYLKQREQYDQQAVESYNWWKDKATAEYQQAAMVLRSFPEIVKFPDYKLTVGDFVEGFKARRAKAVKTVVPVAVKKAPPQPSSQSAGPAKIEPSKVGSEAARSRFNQTGNVGDLEKLIATMM